METCSLSLIQPHALVTVNFTYEATAAYQFALPGVVEPCKDVVADSGDGGGSWGGLGKRNIFARIRSVITETEFRIGVCGRVNASSNRQPEH